MDTSKMRDLVENYYTNLKLLTELQGKELDYTAKITAAYGLNTGGGGGFVNSKTENKAIDILHYKNKMEKRVNEIKIVDISIQALDEKERLVIEKIKVHRNRLGRIAKELHKTTKYVYCTRKRALKKMCEYMEKRNV